MKVRQQWSLPGLLEVEFGPQWVEELERTPGVEFLALVYPPTWVGPEPESL